MSNFEQLCLCCFWVHIGDNLDLLQTVKNANLLQVMPFAQK